MSILVFILTSVWFLAISAPNSIRCCSISIWISFRTQRVWRVCEGQHKTGQQEERPEIQPRLPSSLLCSACLFLLSCFWDCGRRDVRHDAVRHDAPRLLRKTKLCSRWETFQMPTFKCEILRSLSNNEVKGVNWCCYCMERLRVCFWGVCVTGSWHSGSSESQSPAETNWWMCPLGEPWRYSKCWGWRMGLSPPPFKIIGFSLTRMSLFTSLLNHLTKTFTFLFSATFVLEVQVSSRVLSVCL